MNKIWTLFTLCFLAFAGISTAQAKISIPEQLPKELVSDYAEMLTGEQKAELNEKLRAYYYKTTNVFVVVTIPSIEETGEATLQDWNMKLADTWKPGSAEKSNGLIMTISGKVSPFKVRITPGRGLTGSLTDAYLKRMIEDTMKPVLNAPTNYYKGINVAVDAMATKVGEEFSNNGGTLSQENDDEVNGFTLILAAVAGIIIMMIGIVPLWFSSIVGAIIGGFAGFFTTIGVLWGVLAGIVIAFVLGVLERVMFSGGGGGYGGSSGGGWSDSSSSGSDSSFSSGGGFDGGGAGD